MCYSNTLNGDNPPYPSQPPRRSLRVKTKNQVKNKKRHQKQKQKKTNAVRHTTSDSSLRVETVEDSDEDEEKGHFVCNVDDLKTATKLAFKASLADPVVIPMPEG